MFARSLVRNADEADDVVQASLLKAIERVEQFEPNTNLQAWLITIVKNTFLDQQRSHRVTKTDAIEDMGLDFDVEQPGQQIDLVEQSEVRQFIETLEDTERAVVLMWIEGMSYQDIGEALGITRVNVGVVLCRARKRLFTAFNDE